MKKDTFGAPIKTSDEWLKEHLKIDPDFRLLDPDGWDRSNYQYSFYEELISEKTFWVRMLESTIITGKKRNTVF